MRPGEQPIHYRRDRKLLAERTRCRRRPSAANGQRQLRLVVERHPAARHLRVLDLRTEANLDVLGVDDQINTGQHPDVWATCHRLADAVKRWWPEPDALDAVVYRPRTTPETSINYAFFALEPFTYESWPLAERADVLTDLVLRHSFTVGWQLP